jgi:hypothetical protein
MHFRFRPCTGFGLAIAMIAGCSSDDNPLGGPFGGTMTQSVSPTDGSPPVQRDNPNAMGAGSSSAAGGSSSGDSSSSSGSSSSSSSSGGGSGSSSGSGNSASSSSGAGGGSSSSSSGGSSGSSSGSSSSSSSGSSSSGSGSGSGSSGSSGGTMCPGYTGALTWSAIYTQYFTTNCVGCHSEMSTASGAYSWLQQLGYINGTSSKLTKTGSCLTWYGGNMPTFGYSLPTAGKCPLEAWVAAGAKNN